MCMKKRPSPFSHERTRDEQFAPVHHVLEHLDRDDAIELRLRIEHVHISGDHAQIGQAAPGRFAHDIFALRIRVRHRNDPRVRKLPRREQRQRAPAAAEFEDILPVRELGMLDGLAQRLLLGLLQGRVVVPVEAGRVFAVRSEHFCKECGRHLVMLRIGGIGVLGNRPRRHLAREGGIARGAAVRELDRGARAEPVNGGADDRVRQRHSFGGLDDGGDEAHVTTPFCWRMIFPENRSPLFGIMR